MGLRPQSAGMPGTTANNTPAIFLHSASLHNIAACFKGYHRPPIALAASVVYQLVAGYWYRGTTGRCMCWIFGCIFWLVFYQPTHKYRYCFGLHTAQTTKALFPTTALYCFPRKVYTFNQCTHVFAGPMKPGAALKVKSWGTNISANVRDNALSQKLDHLTFFCRF